MIVFIDGTSSSGKSSLMGKFSSKYTKLSADNFRDFAHNKKVKSLKNKYYTLNEISEINKQYKFTEMSRIAKSKKYTIIEAAGSAVLKYLPKKTITVLLYTNIEDLAKNIICRKSIGEFRGNMVFKQFSEKYIKSDNLSDFIDIISLGAFIKALKSVKWLFTSEKELYTFAKETLKTMGINDNKKHFITPRKTNYNIILISDKKSTSQIYNELIKILVNKYKFPK
jgi:hypothetical protein